MENCDFFQRKSAFESDQKDKRAERDKEEEAFQNKIGLFFQGLREGDSYKRFERSVYNAHCDGLAVGDINDGYYFTEKAINCLASIMQSNMRIIFSSIDPATQHCPDIWISCDG